MSFATTTEDATLGAFEACERAKGEDLLEELALPAPPGVAEAMWQELRQSGRTVARARALLLRTPATDRYAADRAVVSAVEHRARLRELVRAHDRSPRRSPAALSQQTGLPESTAFVHLYRREERLDAVWLGNTADGLVLDHISLGHVATGDIERLTAQRKGADQPFAARVAMLDALQAELAGLGIPIAEALLARGVRRLVISPVAPFDLVPLHAAPVELGHSAPMLLDVFDQVTYAPSLRVLNAASSRRLASARPPLIIGAADTGSARALTGVQSEIAMLTALHPSARVLAGADATPTAVLEALSGAGMIHFASHGHVDGERWASGLVLADSPDLGRRLTVADILGEDDMAGLSVAVLNACHTGTHQQHGTVLQTPRGLDAAFFARGARHVVSTLWEVSDVAAMVFSTVFHALLDTVGPSQAYRAAVNILRHVGDHATASARATGLLDQHQPGWVDQLADEQVYGLWSWGAFKLTGCIDDD